MDQLKGAINSFTGGNNNQHAQKEDALQQGGSGSGSGGGFLGGLGDKLNSAAGGGRQSEKDEDYLDKGERSETQLCAILQVLMRSFPPLGVDFVQEKFLGQGPQDNESAVEQAKDEQISDFIRNQCTHFSPTCVCMIR